MVAKIGDVKEKGALYQQLSETKNPAFFLKRGINKQEFIELPGHIHRPQFPDNGNLDLTRVLHFFLDLICDLE